MLQILASRDGIYEVGVRASASEHEYVERLSAVNAGHGFWDTGWEVVSPVRSGRKAGLRGYLVRRDGLTVLAGDAELRPERGEPSSSDTTVEPHPGDAGAWSAGSPVELRHPKELRGVSPGFYVAFSEHPLIRNRNSSAKSERWCLTSQGSSFAGFR